MAIGRPKKGFNDHKILGDTTIIYIITKENKTYEILVDTKDLEIIKGYRWTLKYCKHNQYLYARSTKYMGMVDGKQRNISIYMHILIAGADFEKGEYVDHRNNNTLDNRRENLLITSQFNNTKNRSGKNSNNTSGYRNVSKIGNWWVVQLQVDGKNKLLGKFEDVHEAGRHAEKMRKKYYKDYAGVG